MYTSIAFMRVGDGLSLGRWVQSAAVTFLPKTGSQNESVPKLILIS